MKNLLLLSLFLILSIPAFCSDDITLGLCNKTASITSTELNSCSTLTLNNNQYTIKSFSISFKINGVVYDADVIGNTIPAQFKQDIQTYNPTYILIRKVVLTNIQDNVDRKFGERRFNVTP